ncbi:MAG: metallophosphoesterase [Acidobacteriia bacterium]|nr:metallophosphoesterase [Terriglobia bacterium]
MLYRLRSRDWFRRAVFFRCLFGIRLCACAARGADSFHFAILGDRTGEAKSGVYEQVWREVAAEEPAFVISVGDSIEGLNDQTAATEWRQVDELLKPFQLFELYLTPGKHDVWSAGSERLFQQHARGLHYSFDYKQAHFTILDNSRSEQLSAGELDFLEADLKAHAAQPWKFVISHRPSWLANVALQNTNFPLHRIARRYGVRYVVAGHVHQMLGFQLEGVTYLSMASSGGHLRSSGAYEDGWFFGHAQVTIRGKDIEFQIREVGPPHGQSRITKLADWGMLGLAQKHEPKSVRGDVH